MPLLWTGRNCARSGRRGGESWVSFSLLSFFLETTFALFRNNIVKWTKWPFVIMWYSNKKTTMFSSTATNSSVIITGESQERGNKKTKHAKFSGKQAFLTLWYAHVRVYHGLRKIRFSENSAYFVSLLPPFWDSSFCLITHALCNKLCSEGYCLNNF